MSGENKTLQETVGEVVGKQATANKDNRTTETKEGMSPETQTGETQAGGTPEYVLGIDISDIPEQDRPKFREKLTQKGKLLEDGYNPKFQEVAKFKKAQEDLIKAGLTVEEAQEVLQKHLEQKNNPQVATAKKTEAVKILDKLIEQSPIETRGSLEQMRQIILEETDISELRKEISDLKDRVKEMHGETWASKQSKAEQFVDGLSSKYSKELVDKYKLQMVDAHMRYKIPLERVLQSVVPLDELEQAILSTKTKKPLTEEKKSVISATSSGISSPEKLDLKGKNWQQSLTEVFKTKK